MKPPCGRPALFPGHPDHFGSVPIFEFDDVPVERRPCFQMPGELDHDLFELLLRQVLLHPVDEVGADLDIALLMRYLVVEDHEERALIVDPDQPESAVIAYERLLRLVPAPLHRLLAFELIMGMEHEPAAGGAVFRVGVFGGFQGLANHAERSRGTGQRFSGAQGQPGNGRGGPGPGFEADNDLFIELAAIEDPGELQDYGPELLLREVGLHAVDPAGADDEVALEPGDGVVVDDVPGVMVVDELEDGAGVVAAEAVVLLVVVGLEGCDMFEDIFLPDEEGAAGAELVVQDGGFLAYFAIAGTVGRGRTSWRDEYWLSGLNRGLWVFGGLRG